MTEIIDEQFGGSTLYSPINGLNDFNSGNIKLFAPRIMSVGFNGGIPNAKTSGLASTLSIGNYILLELSGNSLIIGTDYADVNSSIYLITKVFTQEPTDSQVTISIIYNNQERNVVLNNSDTVYYINESWADRDLGDTNSGWLLSSAGNAIFNNVAVRGAINATSGTFSGFMTAGNLKIGTDVNSTNDGIYINSSNYWYDSGQFVLAGVSPTPESLSTKSIIAVLPQYNLTNTVRYTTSTAHEYTTGNSVYISGIFPYFYNGTYIVTRLNDTQFTVPNSYSSTVLDPSGTVVLTTTTTAPALEIYSNGIAAEISDTQNKGVININGAKYRTVFDSNDIQTFDSTDTSSPYSRAKLNIQRLGGDLQVGSVGNESNLFLYGDVYISGNGGGDISYTLEVDGTITTSNNLRIAGNISTVTDITATGDIYATQFRATGGGGSASEVAFGFDGDSGFNSGLYFITENSWGMSSGGTERLRFNTAGSIIMHGGTDLSDSIPVATSAGAAILYSGQMIAAVQVNGGTYEYAGTPLTLQRASDTSALRDGNLVSFYRQGTLQGTISVVSTTVDYNSFAGSHWSQFKDNEMLDIYRGTVLELIDEKCEWYDSDGNLEENEQLMKVKISDTEASAGVYGVFHRYESEDLDNPNDMRVMSLGAYIIRVSSGETVSIGDLLESAGNGCARVQDDNVIKSSTIAKVTGTAAVETYADGSYTIPCVLYCG